MILFKEIRLKSKPQGHWYFTEISKLSGIKKISYEGIQASDVANCVENGCSFIPFRLKLNEDGTFLNRKKESFLGTNWLFLDIDEKMTIQDTINRCNELELPISILYPSFSHSKEKDKFRVGFKLKQDIVDQQIYEFVWRLFTDLVTDNTSDEATKDAGSRLFYGTKYKSIIVNNEAVVDLCKLFPNDIKSVSEMTEEDTEEYTISNGYAYKVKKLIKKREARKKKLKEEVEVFRNYIGAVNNNYNKIDIMTKFENGEYDSIGGYANVYQLMLLYIAIGDDKTFLDTIEKYHQQYLSDWENGVDYAINNFETIGSKYLGEWKKANAMLMADIDTEPSEVITYTDSLSSVKERLETILECEGLQLVKAPTGSGKTYTTVNLFKELSKNNDKVYVILCPNRVQNQQNAEEYKINVAIGGVDVESHHQVISAVYEKIDELIKAHKGKDIVLVVDEAHELVGSISYRKIVNQIDELSEQCRNVIHLTATPRKLKKYYKYDNKYDFVPSETKNNIGNFNIMVSESSLDSLYELLKQDKEKGNKSLVFMTGSKKDLHTLGDTLKVKGYNVGVITSDDKQTDLYQSIVQDSTIPGQYDIVLATKVLTCGTNIKNENITTIQVVTNRNHFDLDDTEQAFARCRKFNNNAYMIIPKLKEAKDIRTFQEIQNDLKDRAEKSVEGLELLRWNKSCTNEEWEDIILGNIKSSISPLVSINNCIVYDKETGLLEVDYKKIINRAYKTFDSQLLDDPQKLLEALRGRIKSDMIQIVDDVVKIDSESLQKDLKETKEITKAIAKENSEKAREIIIDLTKQGYLEEYLYANDKHEILKQFKFVSERLYNDIKFLEKEDKELKKVKALVDSRLFVDSEFKVLIAHYVKLDKQAQIDRFIKHKLYIQQNMVNSGELPQIYSSYGVIRKHFDKVKDKQGRVTSKALLKLIDDLYKQKLLWQFDKQKMPQAYEQYLKETDETKKNKLLERLFTHTLKEMNLIYNFKKDKKSYLISSLK